jgi:hypothetical protein
VVGKIVPKAACAMVLKIVPKAGHELNQLNHESTNEREGRPDQKFDTAFGIIL